MILSDRDIKYELGDGELIIQPVPEVIQPASVDLRISDDIVSKDGHGVRFKLGFIEDSRGRYTYLYPGQFALGSTIEHVEIPNHLVARVEGKSSLGRLGLAVHITAGFIDPGFRGNITLELKNMNNVRIRLEEGMKICQLCFCCLTTPADNPYGSPGLGSKYQDSIGTVKSKFEEEDG